MVKIHSDNRQLKTFLNQLDEQIKYNEKNCTFKDQKSLFNQLVSLESQFTKVLLYTKTGKEMYKKFIHFIMRDDQNILCSRKYFRERQETFTKIGFSAFHNNNEKTLFKLKINYLFAEWIMKHIPERGANKTKLEKIFKKLKMVRDVLITNNIPLALNRVKIFCSKIQFSSLEYLDFIQVASVGLSHAIDKYVPPYNPDIFRGTTVKRILLSILENHNEGILPVSMTPRDKRVLYRIKLAITKYNLSKESDIIKFVNQSFKGTTVNKMRELINAGTEVSVNDSTISVPTMQMIEMQMNEQNETKTPEQLYSNNELINIIKKQIDNLSVLEKKIIKLKYGII